MNSPKGLRALVRAAVVQWTLDEPKPLAGWHECVAGCRQNPLPEDLALVELAAALDLADIEVIAVALAISADEDPLVASELARLQAPWGRGRPLLGFVASRFSCPDPPASLSLRLASGAAVASGLLEFVPESGAFLDRALAVPTHVLHALNGIVCPPPGVVLEAAPVESPPAVSLRAGRYARSLRQGHMAALAIRTASMAEARARAERVVRALGRAPAFLSETHVAGLGPWLRLTRHAPVYELELAPGESRHLESPRGYPGVQLIAATPDGTITLDGAPVLEWKLTIPTPAEREALWRGVVRRELAHELAPHRHSASRIAHLGRLARQMAAVERRPLTLETFHRAAWGVERQALGQLAIPLEDEVTDEALIQPDALSESLQVLLERCRLRDGLEAGLGSSARTRYHPGVRALFAGPPGTGKTLAAGWLAAKLNIPLFRIDLAGVSSKYIGETEKNLARLLNQAEQSELILLFDEADALFGRRTAIQDAHDRYANAQTNYLLQRIETFDGIAILTSNHESDLDPAFTRRLDFVIEFSNPSPADRRRLWLSHLGTHHTLTPQQINRLASSLEIAGGDIRNAVFHAAVLARGRDGKIGWEDVITGLRLEMRKLRITLPTDLTE